MSDAGADRHGRGGEHPRNQRPQEARADLPHPQGAREAQGPDVRRGHARNPARRLRLPPQPRLPLPLLPGRHLRLAEPDPPLRPAQRQHGGRHDPPAQGKRTLLRPAARRRRSTATIRTCWPRKSSSTTSRRVHPDKRIVMETTADEIDDARRRHDRADRLRPARADRQPAAGRQDDPAAEDGQERAHELSRGVRDHAADRRAAGRSHRHGAADQRPALRGDQLARSTKPRPATCRSARWSSRRPSGWSSTATT